MGCTHTIKCQVLVLVGSSRKHSINAAFAKQLHNFHIWPQLQLKLSYPALEQLPIFSIDTERQLFTPKAVKQLRQKAHQVDAILFVTPQINGSVSPLILNAFYWLSRSSDRKAPLTNKKAAVISASYLSQNPIIDCIQMGKQFNMNFHKEQFYVFLGNKVADQHGNLLSSYERGRLEDWFKEFLEFVTEFQFKGDTRKNELKGDARKNQPKGDARKDGKK